MIKYIITILLLTTGTGLSKELHSSELFRLESLEYRTNVITYEVIEHDYINLNSLKFARIFVGDHKDTSFKLRLKVEGSGLIRGIGFKIRMRF